MKIGITYDLKAATTTATDPDVADDAQEEFDRPETIEAIAAVLRGMGHTVTFLGDGREFLEQVLADRPDLLRGRRAIVPVRTHPTTVTGRSEQITTVNTWNHDRMEPRTFRTAAR